MKKHRIIPFLLYKDGQIVQSRNFKHHRIISAADTVLKRFLSWDVDELFFVNISAPDSYDFNVFSQIVSHLSASCNFPLCVGGGISSLRQVEKLIENGADKIFINKALFLNQPLISQIINVFGSQSLVAGVNYHNPSKSTASPLLVGYSDDFPFNDYLKYLEDSGVGEIVLIAKDRDGKGKGFDLSSIDSALSLTTLPIIPFGGASKPQHFQDAFKLRSLEAAAAGNMFHFKENSYTALKKELCYTIPNLRI